MNAAATPPPPDFYSLIIRLKTVIPALDSHLNRTHITELDKNRIRSRTAGYKGPSIVVGREVGLELGPPTTQALNAVMWTSQPNCINDGSISWIGPDLGEQTSSSLPFGQFVLVQVESVVDMDPFVLESIQFLSNRIPGYMVRLIPGRLWARISKKTLRSGFDLAELGSHLINAFKSECSRVKAVEVWFITATSSWKERLDPLMAESLVLAGKHKKLSLGADGVYECIDLNCSACDYQEVCDDIRRIGTIYKRKSDE